MKYNNILHAKCIERQNRFIAYVELEGKTEKVHVKNTGRCKELLLPGCDVVLEKSNNPLRKTLYDLVTVYKMGLGWVNIDSQAPNIVFREWLEGKPSLFGDITDIKQEYTLGNNRVDFCLTGNNRKILIEVKGCTLEVDRVGYFPDAPTERGVKHLNELARAVSEGYECYIAFVIQMPNVLMVYPNIKTHPEFGLALAEAVKAGVRVLYLPCDVKPDELSIIGPVNIM